MDTSTLAPETRRVWEFLRQQTALGGFTLIGGTALAMHIAHRISEDLDFIASTEKLPRSALNGLVRLLAAAGFSVERDDDPRRYDEFLIAGMELHDSQQNFVVDGVKLNIFTPLPDLAGLVAPSSAPLPMVATLDELFRTKALAASNRSASRDWLDLHVLLTRHGYTLADFVDAFHRSPGIHHPAHAVSRAFDNLCRGKISGLDPGYEALLADAPSIEELAEFFRQMRGAYEAQAAEQAFKQRGPRP